MCESPGCDKPAKLQCPTCIKLNIQVSHIITFCLDTYIKLMTSSLHSIVPFFVIEITKAFCHSFLKRKINACRVRTSATKTASSPIGTSIRTFTSSPSRAWPVSPVKRAPASSTPGLPSTSQVSYYAYLRLIQVHSYSILLMSPTIGIVTNKGFYLIIA